MSLSKAIFKASLVLASLIPLTSQSLPVQAIEQEVQNKGQLHMKLEEYTQAFVRQDAKALANLWTEDGTFTDSNGQRFKGRSEIEQAFKQIFAGQKPTPITLTVDNLRFVAQDVAVEDGHATTPGAQGTTYTVVHVNRGGEWQMLDAVECQDNARETLKDLDWLIGEWQIKELEKVLMTVSVKANSPKNFLELTYRDPSGTLVNKELIGVDPASGNLTSWTFHSSGGVGRSIWHRTDSGWLKQSRSREANGALGRATYILHPDSPDRFTYSSSERYLSGHSLDNIKNLVGVKTAEAAKQ
ncbi:MAG: SgcJ/EcaC family oxidoreductase [Candidatus Obscuribacter sp.]|nr:SgcJ/EcaC family oxidoreductase [Candidatus Obscuribacter sp.]MBP6592899.1 SgcJ/EcaC family oxidoreductase [Candidatus Obscuribacter sp.]